MSRFDVIIIGAGTGLDVAPVAARKERSVAVVDDGPLGGTCLNRGCIPSKMLIHHADVVETIRDSDRFDITADIAAIDFANIARSVNDAVAAESRELERILAKTDPVTLYRDEARFVDERTLAVGDETVVGDTVIIAVGARPFVPPIDGIERVPYLTSTEALQLEERPDHLLVVGGGYIAAELGHFYGALGSEVTILGRRDRLLPNEDLAIGEAFTEAFGRKYDVRTGHEVTGVEAVDDDIAVHAAGPDGDVTVSGDALLVATGLRPNTDRLDVERAGVETDARGYVVVDEYLRTSADGVWALGDVIGRYQFKHAAVHEARHLVTNAFDDETPDRSVTYRAVPHAVFASPQVAAVGQTERELDDAGIEHAVRRYEYGDTVMGRALKADGFVKALADPESGEILGCHIVGPEAPTLVHEVVVAMCKGGTVKEIGDAVHAHPSLSEVVHRAFAGEFERHPVQFDVSPVE